MREVGELEQRGNSARVDALNQFIAPNGRFNGESIGKKLTILDSDFPENNITTEITSVVSSTTVVTADILLTDVGPLSWELRPAVDDDEDTITLEVRSGDVAAIKPGWVLSDGFSEFTVVARRQFQDLNEDPLSLTLREGTDGTINGSGNFVSSTASFSLADVGRLISISTSAVPENNNRWEIREVVSTTEAVVVDQAGNALQETGVAFFWAILPFAELDLAGQIEPRGHVELEGLQGEITGANTFKISTGEFTDNDVGKLLTLRGCDAAGNNITTAITAVNGDEATVEDALTSPDDGIFTPPSASPSIGWEMRESTGHGADLIEVRARPTSMIRKLAPDFGIEIDNQESEDRQRSWVANVSRWINQKGTVKAYEILAAISGFEATVEHPYHVSESVAEGLPAEVLEIGESAEGRSGTDGILSVVSLRTRFSSPTAAFKSSDVGSHVRVRDADTPANNRRFTIAEVIDANTIEAEGDASLPETNNGALTWALIRLYATKPPLFPDYDDFDSDWMEAVIDGYEPQATNKFGVDKYCWEDDFFADIEIVIDTVTQIAPGRFQVETLDGPPQGPSNVVPNASIIRAVRRWSLIDSAGAEFFVETVPTSTSPYTFEVRAALPPATGSGTLRYNCPVQLSCDYCGSNRVLVTLTAGSILDEIGVATEAALERVLKRMEDVVPAHVVLVPKYSQSIEASLSLSMNMTISAINHVLYMPKDAYYDDVQADILVADADPNNKASDYHTSDTGQADYPYTDLVLRCTIETP